MNMQTPISKPTGPFDCQLLEHSFQVEHESIPGVRDGSVTLAFADPPYNIGVKYADDPTGDWRSPSDYFQWCQTVIEVMARTLRVGGTMWWLCPEQHGDTIGPMLERVVGPRLYRIIWRESFAQYQQHSLTADYRFLFCHRKQAEGAKRPDDDLEHVTFNPDAIREPSVRQEMGDKRADPRGRVPGQVWDIRRLQGTAKDRVKWHPAQLPPELLNRIVLGWSNPGDLVLDAFGGSGTMGEACKAYDRRCILIDQSPTYLQKIRERLGLDQSTSSGSSGTEVS